jgi:hypothetical protein
MNKITQERLRSKAAEVARTHRNLVTAVDEQTAEEVGLLHDLGELLGPALDALSSKLPGAFSAITVEDGKPKGVRKPTLREERGCILVNGFGKDSAPDGRHGRYFGQSLVLQPTGNFALLEYEGRWSAVPGETSAWNTTLRPVEPSEVTTLFGADEILRAIDRALDSHLSGSAERRADEAREAAEKIRSVRVLLAPDRMILPGLRVAMARKLWLARNRTGFPCGGPSIDPNDAAESLKRVAADGREIKGQCVWRRRSADEVAVVRMADGQVVAIGDEGGAWGAVIGLLNAHGRFQML